MILNSEHQINDKELPIASSLIFQLENGTVVLWLTWTSPPSLSVPLEFLKKSRTRLLCILQLPHKTIWYEITVLAHIRGLCFTYAFLLHFIILPRYITSHSKQKLITESSTRIIQIEKKNPLKLKWRFPFQLVSQIKWNYDFFHFQHVSETKWNYDSLPIQQFPSRNFYSINLIFFKQVLLSSMRSSFEA